MASISKKTLKNGNIAWRACIRRKGHPSVDRSFVSRKAAQDWADMTEEALLNPYRLRPTLDMMVDRYVEEVLPTKSVDAQKDEKYHITFWKEQLGKDFIDELTPHQVETTANMLYQRISRTTKQPLTSESRRKFLMTLSYIFRTASKWNWIKYNPVSLVSKHKPSVKKPKVNIKEANISCPIRKNFLDELEKEMAKRGFSQGGLAYHMKLAKSTIQSLFNPNMNLTINMMKRVCNALNKTLDIKIYDKLN